MNLRSSLIKNKAYRDWNVLHRLFGTFLDGLAETDCLRYKITCEEVKHAAGRSFVREGRASIHPPEAETVEEFGEYLAVVFHEVGHLAWNLWGDESDTCQDWYDFRAEFQNDAGVVIDLVESLLPEEFRFLNSLSYILGLIQEGQAEVFTLCAADRLLKAYPNDNVAIAAANAACSASVSFDGRSPLLFPFLLENRCDFDSARILMRSDTEKILGILRGFQGKQKEFGESRKKVIELLCDHWNLQRDISQEDLSEADLYNLCKDQRRAIKPFLKNYKKQKEILQRVKMHPVTLSLRSGSIASALEHSRQIASNGFVWALSLATHLENGGRISQAQEIYSMIFQMSPNSLEGTRAQQRLRQKR